MAAGVRRSVDSREKAMLGPRQEIYRASCNDLEIRLRINPDNAWVVIRGPGREPFYRDLDQGQVASALAEFHAIGKDPDRFQQFVHRLLYPPILSTG